MPHPGQLLIQEVNNHYGDWIVLSYAGNRKGKSMWLCRCACGREYVVCGTNLRNGKSLRCKHCAKCHPSAKRLPKGQSGFNMVFHRYKVEAVKRHLEFALSKRLFKFIQKQKCYYCGVLQYNNEHGYRYNGIDRVDNAKGYIGGNCVSCCSICNRAKMGLTISRFYRWIKRIKHNE